MLLPRPPILPPPRRAVPEVTVRVEAREAITVGHVLPARKSEDAVAAAAGMPAGPLIRFTVIYRLREYLALLQEHVPAAMPAHVASSSGRLPWGTRAALRVLVPLMGTPIFLLKKRRMPVCRFTIDDQGIERDTRAGRLRVAWPDVVAVHRYRAAYLVHKGNGALPIPYRCLDEAQRAAFERLLASRFDDDTPV